MPIVNYVREHIRFMEYATDEHLSASERLVWYALMHIMNQRAQGNCWPEEFVRISNERLLSYCPMKWDTMADARNRLKNRGLIEYEEGKKNKRSPAYRMIYFCPEYIPPATEQDGSYPKKSDNMGGNMGGNPGGNMGGNMGGNHGGNMGDIYINYTREYSTETEMDEDDDEEDSFACACACAMEEAASAWRAAFGRPAAPAVLRRAATASVNFGFEAGVLSRAIRAAALKGAHSPLDYLLETLRDWYSNGVRTAADAEEYAVIYDALRGKGIGGISTEQGYEMLQAFRQAHRTQTGGAE